MVKISNYEIAKGLLNDAIVEKIYPLSIVEEYQNGEIYVDHIDHPTFVLFWHYCGFAFINGICTKDRKNELYELFNISAPRHHNRMIVQMEKECDVYEDESIMRGNRYIFSFEKECKKMIVPEGCQICQITDENYNLISGNIIPSFSWENREEFLQKGFGFCLMKGNEVLACAFSAGISEEFVDIGIETNEKYRGNGYAKIVAAAMVEKILKQGKIPMWACDIRNEGSMRVARAVGFQIEGMHPWYKLG